MINKERFKIFPFYNQISAQDMDKLRNYSVERKMEKGQFMMGDSGRCNGIPLILSGTMRLFRMAENGREINVYNVNAGELCVLAAVCALAEFEYDFSAQAQTDCILAVIPPEGFRHLMSESEVFKNYVFTALSDKLVAALRAIEMLNFSSIEDRLSDYLYYHADKDNVINATHEMIARDIGSSREVVSRQLKKFEHQGLLKLKRGRIELN